VRSGPLPASVLVAAKGLTASAGRAATMTADYGRVPRERSSAQGAGDMADTQTGVSQHGKETRTPANRITEVNLFPGGIYG